MHSIDSPKLHNRRTNAIWIAGLVSVASAQGQETPEYLKYRFDPVQQIYSKSVVGFAIDKKCRFLSASQQSEYERDLNRATQVFHGYISVKTYVTAPAQAPAYSRQLILGAIKYAANFACDTTAQDAIETGAKIAKGFESEIEPALREPLRK